MVNTNLEPTAILDFDTDQNGNWQVDLPSNLPPGLHTIVVKDEQTGAEDVAFFSVQTNEVTTYVDRVVNIVPGWLLYTILFFVFVVLVLAANNLRLAWKGRTERKNTVKMLSLYSVVLSVVAMIVSLGVGAVIVLGLLKEQAVTESTLAGLKSATVTPVEVIDRYTGAIVNPLDGDLVKDVKLKYKEVEISTSEGGNFVFTNIQAGENIEFFAENLKAKFEFQVPEDGLYEIWYYNQGMFGLVADIVLAESDKKISTVYTFLADEEKKSLVSEKFVDGYEGLYVGQAVDSIVISDIKRVDDWKSGTGSLYPRVFGVDLKNGDKIRTYYLVYESGNWKMIE